jgi:hypothetical protein
MVFGIYLSFSGRIQNWIINRRWELMDADTIWALREKQRRGFVQQQLSTTKT